LSDIVDVIAV